MKSVFIYLFVLFFSNAVFSQPLSQLEINENLGKYIDHYYYSEQLSSSDTGWVLSKQRYQEFDNNDLLKKFRQVNWEYDLSYNTIMTTFDYDDKGNLVLSITYNWSGTNNEWSESSKEEITYDEQNRVIQHDKYSWFAVDWYLRNRVVNIYNEKNQISEKITIDNYNSPNYDTSKIVYVYDYVNRLVEEKTQKMKKGEWIDDKAVYYTYLNHNVILEESVFWYAGEKFFNTKDTIIYDENDKVIERVKFKWYDYYVPDIRTQYNYDEKGRLIETVTANWVGSWQLDRKVTITYDDEDKILNKLTQKFRNDKWVDEIEINLNYNDDSKLIEYISKIKILDDWKDHSLITYSYEPTSVDEVGNKNTVIISPNPFSHSANMFLDIMNSSNYNLYIFDNSGKLVKEKSVGYLKAGKNTIVLDLLNLSPGMYFYQVIGENSIFKGNFTVIK